MPRALAILAACVIMGILVVTAAGVIVQLIAAAAAFLLALAVLSALVRFIKLTGRTIMRGGVPPTPEELKATLT